MKCPICKRGMEEHSTVIDGVRYYYWKCPHCGKLAAGCQEKVDPNAKPFWWPD